MRNKADDFASLLLTDDYDISFLTETWLSSVQDESSIIRQTYTPSQLFHYFNIPRNYGQGGGLAVIFKQTTNLKLVFKNSTPDIEIANFKLVTETSISIWLIYRPPRGNMKKFWNVMNDDIIPDSLENNLIVVGDFNLPNSAALEGFFSQSNLNQLVNVSTHKYGNILDLVITNNPSLVSDLMAMETEISDHKLITFNLNTNKPVKRNSSSRMKFIWNKGNWDKIAYEVRLGLDLNEHITDVTEMSYLLDECFLQSITENVPTGKSAKKSQHCPFFDQEMIVAKRQKRKAERHYRRTKTTIEKFHLMEAIKHCKQLFIQKKTKFYDENVNCKKDLKKKFKNLSDLLGENEAPVLPTTHGNDYMLACAFGAFFKKKVQCIRDSIPTVEPDQYISKSTAAPMLEFCEISRDVLEKSLAGLSNSTCSLDPLPTIKLKETKNCWIEFFLLMINKSFKTGVYPDTYKVSIIKPLLKSSSLNPELLKSYRPLANIYSLSKIMEREATNQLIAHVTMNNLLDPYQSAYRQHYSTETCLLNTCDYIVGELDKKKVVIVLGVDLSAAFDTLDYEIMEKILKNRFRLEGKCLSWILSYLSNRTTCVEIIGEKSPKEDVHFGVPQGSILGPILFSMYVTPVGDYLRTCNLKYQMYADDTMICLSIDEADLMNVENRLNIILSKLIDVYSSLKLKINPDKTEVLIIPPKRLNVTIEKLFLAGEEIIPVNFLKSLGVLIDNNLSWSRQINATCSSCYNQLRKLNRIKQYLSIETRIVLVRTLILSRLDYCNSLLSGATKASLNKLQLVQNAAARFIGSVRKYESVNEILYSLHWIPIHRRIEYKSLMFAHQIMHQPSSLSYLTDSFHINREANRKSTIYKFKPIISKTSKGEKRFSSYASKLWNSLPLNLREQTDKETYRSELKTYLFKRCYFSEIK